MTVELTLCGFHGNQELLHYNQVTMAAVQSGLGAGDVGHQLIALTRVIEDMKEKHR